MARFGFPPVIEMSDELVGLIAADCGYAESSSAAALRWGVPVLVALGLCPELPFRKLADACWGEGWKQKELKSIVEMLVDREVVTFAKPYYSLKEPPKADKVARWLEDAYFASFLEKVKEWSRCLVEKSTSRPTRQRIGVMYAGMHWAQVQLMPPEAPDFLSPYYLCRILRLRGEHALAYRILRENAQHPDLLDFRLQSHSSMSALEVRRWYYGLLNNHLEPVSSQPQEMRDNAFRDNTLLSCLSSRNDDDFFQAPDAVERICRTSSDAELLFSIVFHCLQRGEWAPIRALAAEEAAPVTVRNLAVRLCQWTDKKRWTALRGAQKELLHFSAVSIMLTPILALANTVNKANVKSLYESVFYAVSTAYGRSLYSLVEGMLLLREGERSGDEESLLQYPIGSYFLLLATLAHPDTMELSPEDTAMAAAACITLQRRGLTLYSWYMASILLGQGSIPQETREELQRIVDSRSDLVSIPGLRSFTGQDDLVLEKFLEAVRDIAGENSSESKRAVGQMDWEIELFGDGVVHEVIPIYRSCTKKGKLSDGRKAGLAALKEGKYDACLTAQDAAVVTMIRYVSSWDGGYYYIPASAVQKLCGHPHLRVEWEKREYRDISLTPVSARLNIRKKGEACAISLPDTACEHPTLLHLGEDKFGLQMPSAAESKLRQLIGKLGNKGELVLPAKGKQSVAEALSALSSQFRLTGDLSIAHANLAEVQAATKLVALLSGREGSFLGTLSVEAFAGAALLVPGKGESSLVMNRGEEKILLHRNLKQEQKALSSLLKACPTLRYHIGNSVCWQVDAPETALDILSELQDYGQDNIELRWPEGQSLSLCSLASGSSFNLQVGETAERWLNVGGEVRVDETRVLKFTELLELSRNRSGSYICLGEGQFLRLTRSISRQLETLSTLLPPADKSGRARKTLELSPAAVALLASTRQDAALPAALEAPVQRVREQLDSCRNSRLPRALRAELRDYQLTGYRWLMQLISNGIGACLADDMGLGKTVQILSVLLAKAGEGPSLVLAPASVCANWVREAQRFTPTLQMHQLRNTGRSELLEKLGARDVLVCSYGLLVSEADALSGISWNTVVLDEAQSIKNSRSQRAEQARRLTAKYRIAATGTPLENNLLELWSLMEFLNPGFLGARSSFLSRFKDSPARLRRLISPFVLRRLKSDVLDELPEKLEQVLQVELSEKERALYEAQRRRALQEMSGETERFRVLAHLTRLRRLCCHPQLGVPDCGLTTSSKLEALRELAAELQAGGHRTLIFSQFTDVLEHVRSLCEEEHFSYLYLDGSTPTATRSSLVDIFQQGETDFFLISLKAGGVGLNLTAADYVILLDPWWNPATEDQAADRAYRIGQDKNVTVCRLVCADTIEQRVLELHAQKRELVDSVLTDSPAAAETLSIEELLQLLK